MENKWDREEFRRVSTNLNRSSLRTRRKFDLIVDVYSKSSFEEMKNEVGMARGTIALMVIRP